MWIRDVGLFSLATGWRHSGLRNVFQRLPRPRDEDVIHPPAAAIRRDADVRSLGAVVRRKLGATLASGGRHLRLLHQFASRYGSTLQSLWACDRLCRIAPVLEGAFSSLPAAQRLTR